MIGKINFDSNKPLDPIYVDKFLVSYIIIYSANLIIILRLEL